MRKRARAKWITAELLSELEALDSPIPYDRARSCCRVIRQEDGALKASYCRCRWCIVCSRIRTGTIINRYEPIFRLWAAEEGVFMVTLSRPNVRGPELRGEIKGMKADLRRARRSVRRTCGLDYRAVESWEVTYNPITDTYNAHVHAAVRGKAQALAIREEWLKRCPTASEAAQDVRKWDGGIGGLKELAKYTTKLYAPAEDKERPPAEALDVIFRALYRLHLCSPTGFDIDEEQARAESYLEGVEIDAETTARPERDEQDGDAFDDLKACVAAYSEPSEGRLWVWEDADWIDRRTGECLTGHTPDDSRSPP
jgi:hypothetical protein